MAAGTVDTLSFLAPRQMVQVVWSGDPDELVVLGRVRAATDDDVTISLIGAVLVLSEALVGQAAEVRVLTDESALVAPVTITAHDTGQGRLTVRRAGVTNPLQRRQYTRLDTHLRDVQAAVLDAAGRPQRRLAVTVLDLSGGGARMICPLALAPHDRLRLVLPLGEGEVVAPVLTVLTCTRQSTIGAAPPVVKDGDSPMASVMIVDRRRLSPQISAIVAQYAQLTAEVPSTPGDIVEVDSIRLPTKLKAALIAAGAASQPAAIRADDPGYAVRGRFVAISDLDRRLIIRFIYRQQMERQRHGAGPGA